MNVTLLASLLVDAKNPNLAGFKVLPVSGSFIESLADRLYAAGNRYVFGGKPDSLSAEPTVCHKNGVLVNGMDCSGFMRLAVFKASSGKCLLVDGSYSQCMQIDSLGLKKSSYAALALNDGLTRICFHLPDQNDETGHVWIVRNGRTTECYGGHGPGHRPWYVNILKILLTRVYVLSETP